MTLYFVQGSGKHERAHIAKAGTKREVLVYAHFDAACGARVSSYHWSLRDELGTATLCEACAKAKGLSIMDAGDTP